LAADDRKPAAAGARRRPRIRATLAAALLACAGAARAQFAGTLTLASEDRYRGIATDDTGPVLRAAALADASCGAYAAVSSLWRTRDAGFARAEALLGWSGRLEQAFAGLDPAWGWDLAWHRTHYGESSRYDFSEAMAGLLAPGWSARLWGSPHYMGTDWPSLYAEVDASRELGEHWRAFGHLGTMRYGRDRWGQRVPGRTDGMLGIAWVDGDRELRLQRDGLLDGEPVDGTGGTRRGAGWVLSASLAF
jgi:hypothetical protein